MIYDVFISYARRDGIPLAKQIAEKLRQTGLHVFWDQDSIPAGSNWEQKLDEALEHAEHIVVVLTPFSVVSEEVTAEWRPMLSRGKNVIPLMYITCDVPRRLSMRQYIDFRDRENDPTALTELVEAINSFRPQSAQLELSGHELMQRAQVYYEADQLELAARDYLRALKNSDIQLRARAARFLGKSRVPSVLFEVIQCTHEEENPSVKAELLTTIMRYAELTDWRKSVPDLVQQLEPYLQSADPEIRRQTIRVYAYGQAIEAVPLIVQKLKHDASAIVRSQAALALGRLKTVEALQGLLGSLNEPDENTQVAIVQALGVHGNPDVINPLKVMTGRDRSANVRKVANEVITELRNQSK